MQHQDRGVPRRGRVISRGGALPRRASPGGGADPEARVKTFPVLWGRWGAEPMWLDAETHDWAAAIVSHLPQLLAIALAGVVRDETDETGLPASLGGRGLRDMLR